MSFVRSIADTLRGDFKESEYGKVILAVVVLRRLGCGPEELRDDCLALSGQLREDVDDAIRDRMLSETAGRTVAAHNLGARTSARMRRQGASRMHQTLTDDVQPGRRRHDMLSDPLSA